MAETRVGHWKRERARCTVYIGRGSVWGNPFVPPGFAKRSKYPVTEVANPLAAYEVHVLETPELASRLHELEGQVLGCFCVSADDPMPRRRSEWRCHGHVLAHLVSEVCRG